MISNTQNKGPLIECVLNLSEGRNTVLLDKISTLINDHDGASVIHRDIGIDANRTVFTIAGVPEIVINCITAIFEIAAIELDMSTHQGVHPCTGALDVIPIIPIQHISYSDCEILLRSAAQMWSSRFNVPICYYGTMSKSEDQSTLAQIRKGGYTNLYKRIENKTLVIDESPLSAYDRRLGLSSCTVRQFMIAYNINLETQDLVMSKKIAAHLRHLRLENQRIKDVRFIGWYMEEYGTTQISTNIYDIAAITMQELYHYVDEVARSYAVKCNGSELIGLTPMRGLTRDTANYLDVTLEIGLSSVVDFNPKNRILENTLGLPSLL